MFRTLTGTLCLALVCSTAAWAADPQQQQSQQQDRSGGAAATGANAAEDRAQAAADREEGQQDPAQMFIKDAYIHNLFEIQLAQLASQRAQDDQIKQFARMMVEDHTKANQQLKQIAQSASVQAEERLDAVHQAKLQKAQKWPASEFGRKYIFSQVGGHTMNVLEFRYQSQNAQNEQVKQYASQTLPKLEQHLQQANKIATQQAGGEAGTAAGRFPADTSGQRSQDRQGTSGTSSRDDRSATSDKDAAGQSGQSGQSGATDKDASSSPKR